MLDGFNLENIKLQELNKLYTKYKNGVDWITRLSRNPEKDWADLERLVHQPGSALFSSLSQGEKGEFMKC